MTSNIKSKAPMAITEGTAYLSPQTAAQLKSSVTPVKSAPGSLNDNPGVREGEVLEVDGILVLHCR